MKTVIFLIILLSTSVYADVEIDMWILPVKVFYTNQTAETLWIEHNPSEYYYKYNQIMNLENEPHPGKNIMFMNKLGDKRIKASKKLYNLPDGYQCLIENSSIDLSSVAMIEVINTDSIHPTGGWSSCFVNKIAGKTILEKKCLFTDNISVEDGGYRIIHVYCFDNAFTKEQIRKLWSNGEQKNPSLKKACQEGSIVIIEEVTP
jgi:hypothetical protein